MFKFQLPDEVKVILEGLKNSGFNGYIVGGCVRDCLMNRVPSDWDICSSALPKQVIKIFGGNFTVVPTGLKHGTVTIVINKKHFEVTTFRIDGDYLDNRRPESVTFSNSLIEDVSRRDFTINALAYNESEGLIDAHNGLDDINYKIIRCVGSPDLRMKEDFLRALRAIRFSCQLGFQIDGETFNSILDNCELINNISKERIRDELIKILLSSTPSKGILMLKETALLKFIIPELDKFITDTFASWRIIDCVSPVLIIRLAALLHILSSPVLPENSNINISSSNFKIYNMSQEILKRLKFDNSVISRVTILLKESIDLSNTDRKRIKEMINRIGIENLDNLFELETAIAENRQNGTIDKLNNIKKICFEIISDNEPLTIKDLNINGNDLSKLGIKPGQMMGQILRELMDMVLENPGLNKKETLIQIAKEKLPLLE